MVPPHGFSGCTSFYESALCFHIVAIDEPPSGPRCRGLVAPTGAQYLTNEAHGAQDIEAPGPNSITASVRTTSPWRR
jgi:hypothetical protein